MNPCDFLRDIDNTIHLDIPMLKIRSSNYITPVFTYINKTPGLSIKKIRNLDSIVFLSKEFELTINMPFMEGIKYKIHEASGIITNQIIIDSIRSSYRHAYRNHINSRNQITIKGGSINYDFAYPLSGLYLEDVIYNKTTNALSAYSDGMIVILNKNLPF